MKGTLQFKTETDRNKIHIRLIIFRSLWEQHEYLQKDVQCVHCCLIIK